MRGAGRRTTAPAIVYSTITPEIWLIPAARASARSCQSLSRNDVKASYTLSYPLHPHMLQRAFSAPFMEASIEPTSCKSSVPSSGSAKVIPSIPQSHRPGARDASTSSNAPGASGQTRLGEDRPKGSQPCRTADAVATVPMCLVLACLAQAWARALSEPSSRAQSIDTCR